MVCFLVMEGWLELRNFFVYFCGVSSKASVDFTADRPWRVVCKPCVCNTKY